MNKGIYLLFLFICSSLSATTPNVGKTSSGTISISTTGVSTTVLTTNPIKTTTTKSVKTATTKTLVATNATRTTPTTAKSTTVTPTTATSTTVTPTTATSMAANPKTATSTTEYASEASPTPLPSSLSEKLDYQIYQTHLLSGIVGENHAALKRLLSMMSHLLDNNAIAMINHTNNANSFQQTNSSHERNEENHRIETIPHLNQVVHPDNDTLHVSFGVDADPDRYPWAVALRGNDRDRCGGTLIDDQHVLTAAHCIGTRTTTVSLGSHLYDGGEEVKTNFYCVHNAYSSSNYYRNDLAIIRLAKPVSVRLPKRVSTIDLCNRSNIINVTISSNAVNLWMVGWGLKNNDIEPDELQEAQVILADRSMCKGSSRYTDMCVQSRPNTSPMGACTGDSGSGLFQQTILTNQWCILGLASSSNTDICEQTQFTTYVQASSQDYVEWFRDVLDRKKTLEELQKMEKCKARTWGQELCRWYAC